MTIFLFLYKSSLYVLVFLCFYLFYLFFGQICYVMYGKFSPRFVVCLLALFMVYSVTQMVKHCILYHNSLLLDLCLWGHVYGTWSGIL